MSFYLDTSVVVASLVTEGHSARALTWLANHTAEEFVISAWVVTEMASALAAKVRSREITLADRDEMAGMFLTLCRDHFMVLPVSSDAFAQAASFARNIEAGLKSGDALHLAIASTYGATIATLDRRLAEGANTLAVAATLI